jgi:molybdenum cofactor cytidylyltransferase
MFDCVMTAAGASSRMRSSDGSAAFKPLLPFAGATLAETAAWAAIGAGCRLLLVVGHRGEEVAAAFDTAPYRAFREAGSILVVRNPRWAEGLLGSIQAALPFVRGEAFFIAHADMPFLLPEDYAALASARAARAAEGAAESAAGGAAGEAVLIASCGGKRGHPVLLPAAWAPEIAALPPGDRLWPFLRERPAALVEIGPAALRDVDSPEDYELAIRSGPSWYNRPPCGSGPSSSPWRS